ncbi:hypothetical protein DFH08DRAFT_800011 [Mycena albidolilacea]|uniref:Uncharacterized protein n=1 Tax=Mycena albidolilacea TaxID=1033008 RepID=A0AAD7AMS4_9AGAR|nr:hypothetical protein DFH08DRAFT_800011 [Mycena albidolilacea]
MLGRALVTLAYLAPCFCKVYKDVAQLPGLSYDFVIVGGGTAGNVVANRLTEDPDFSVLVWDDSSTAFMGLEAGVFNKGVIDSFIPGLVDNLLQPNIYEGKCRESMSSHPRRMQHTHWICCEAKGGGLEGTLFTPTINMSQNTLPLRVGQTFTNRTLVLIVLLSTENVA